MPSGSLAKFSNSGQGTPATTYATIDVGNETTDADNIVSESAGVFTPTEPGYYLILATGRFDSTHNNRSNIVWNILRNGTNVAGTAGSGYARNSANRFVYIRAGAILFFNGTTDTFSVQHKRDSGEGTVAGTYGFTRLKLVNLGNDLPYGRYGTPTQALYGGNVPTVTTGWDVITETDTDVIQAVSGSVIRLKEANRPYLVVYALQNNVAASVRTTRVSDITLGGTRIGHSGGYAYQRDSSNENAVPFGMALVYPTTADQDLNVRCWGYDDDAATLWGTFANGTWNLSSAAGDAGIMVIALPPTVEVAIFDDTTGGDTMSGSGTIPLNVMKTVIKPSSNFTLDSANAVTVNMDSDVLAWGATMVERTASSGARNTTAVRWQIEGVNQDDTAYGNYLRGEQAAQDCKNMVVGSNYIDSVSSGSTFQMEKFDPGTDDGAFDTTTWGGAFLKTLIVSGPSTNGQIKFWNGSTFQAKPIKFWNGAAWLTKPLKRWNGSAWIETNY
jgi:hypothetical protein